MTTGPGIEGFALTRLAPAKINLALHVVGQRTDGYHLLESLVTFADAGDRIGFSLSPEDRFTLSGPFCTDLPLNGMQTDFNLVLKARDLLRAHLMERGIATPPVHLHLEKNMPVASGIGGGSADAAATLRGLLDLWGSCLDCETLRGIGLKIGADVPMCLEGRPLVAKGIGDEIAALAHFPSFPILILNPLKAVSTPVIFRMLEDKKNPPLRMLRGRRPSREDWIAYLKGTRNDLQQPAQALEPVIGDVCDALTDAGAAFVRMSGSGASCFGVFKSTDEREAAAAILSTRNPGWYALACSSVNGEQGNDDRD